MKPRKQQHPVGRRNVQLMDEDALLPREAEYALEDAVGDSRAADQRDKRRHDQQYVDGYREFPVRAPFSAPQGREPEAVPHKMKKYGERDDDAHRFMVPSRKYLEAHQEDEQPKEQNVQTDPFHHFTPQSFLFQLSNQDVADSFLSYHIACFRGIKMYRIFFP